MKKIILLFYLINSILNLKSYAQSSEIKSNQGISVPRFDTAIINAMTTQPKGTIVFDKDLNVMKYWDGTFWQPMNGGSGSSQWTTYGSGIYNSNSGNVGIGVSIPSAKLEINGTFKLTDGTEGVNKVLTSDADGLASWQSAPNLNVKFGFDLSHITSFFPTDPFILTSNYNTDPTNVYTTNTTTLRLVRPGIYRFGLLGIFHESTLVNAGAYVSSVSISVIVNSKEYKVALNAPVTIEGIYRRFRQQSSLTFDLMVPENSDVQIKLTPNGWSGPQTHASSGYLFGYLVSE